MRLDEDQWPSESFCVSDIKMLEERTVVLTAEVKTESQYDIFNRFSKFTRSIRVVTFCHRFIRNCKVERTNASHTNHDGDINKVQPNNRRIGAPKSDFGKVNIT